MRHILWLLLAVALVSRLLFPAGEPYSWDSYNYYLAVEHFRPAEDMAHFPGYFNYVMAVQPLGAVFSDPNGALVAWSVLMSVLLVGLLYVFARGPIARLLKLHHADIARVGVVAAVLMIVNPMAWFYGEVALGYINGAVAGIAAVWSILSRKQSWWQWLLPPLLIGWLMGFRLETALLGLLWIRQGVKERVPAKVWTLGVVAGIAGVLLWVLPTAAYAGSWETYWRQGASLLARSSESYREAHGGLLQSMAVNFARLAVMLLLAAGFGLVPLLLRPRRLIHTWQRLPGEFRRVVAWWTLPVIVMLYCFFLLPGYLMLIQPALTLLIAALLVRGAASARELRRGVLVAVGLSLLYFVLPFPQLPAKQTPPPFTAERIRWNDARGHAFRAILATRLAPDSSAVICYDEFYPWRAAMIDFPEIPAYQIVDATHARYVVEGYRKRERGSAFALHEPPPMLDGPVRRVAVVRRDNDERFARDFPEFKIRDVVGTEYGAIYFAERKEAKRSGS